MSIKLLVKNSQKEDAITKLKFQSTWYVDDAMVDGLKHGFFCAMNGAGTSNGVAQGTLTYAGAADKTYTLDNGDTVVVSGRKADGIVYTASSKDAYGRTDDVTDETMLFPYGKREGTAIGLLKKAVIEMSDDSLTGQSATQFRYYYTKDVSLGTPDSETANTGSGTSDLVWNSTDLTDQVRVGNKLHIATDDKVVYVTEVTYAGGNTTVVVNSELDGTASEVTTQCQIGDPIYLATDMSGDLPWTTIATTETGEILQPAGYIESPIAVRVNLDVNASIVA